MTYRLKAVDEANTTAVILGQIKVIWNNVHIVTERRKHHTVLIWFLYINDIWNFFEYVDIASFVQFSLSSHMWLFYSVSRSSVSSISTQGCSVFVNFRGKKQKGEKHFSPFLLQDHVAVHSFLPRDCEAYARYCCRDFVRPSVCQTHVLWQNKSTQRKKLNYD